MGNLEALDCKHSSEILWKCGKVKIFGRRSHKWKRLSWLSSEQMKSAAFLLSFQSGVLWQLLCYAERQILKSVISGFRCDVDEICAPLGYHAASNCKPLPTFRDNISVLRSRVKKSSEASLDCLTIEDGTDKLSRNVGKGLQFYAAWYPTRAQISNIKILKILTYTFSCMGMKLSHADDVWEQNSEKDIWISGWENNRRL
jgi:hypothetical protein